MSQPLSGKICLVTGATRGIGKGIALQLGEAGATVYITGKTLKPKPDSVGGSLEETSREIESRGGKCVPVQCDHSKDDQIKALFERIEKEQHGRLDVLVNNAYAAVTSLMNAVDTPFWELPVDIWDNVNNVGLRNHYICSFYAAKMMVPAKQGLIVNISSGGGLRYLFNVAYGVGKAAVDRLAADCAHEMKKHNVAAVSLWPGAVKTELIMDKFKDPDMSWKIGDFEAKGKDIFMMGESPEYAGKCVVGLAQDKNIMRKTGKVLLTMDLADEYGFTDVDGHRPMNYRQVKSLFLMGGHTWIGALVPGFIKVPFWLLASLTHKY
ncbi:dehydrogenase/reductase SDR family member 1-like [Diadema antillarum]|uniref:dehydrogenase/reductase SDR family member 1-like n=1 Tax=Diadema antillarum TaxID=105358 RepID=UPI003A87E7BE